MRSLYIWIILTCFLVCSCDKPNEPIPLAHPNLSLKSEVESVNPNEVFKVSIKIDNVDIPVYGTYLKISIDTTKISITENNSFQIGDFWDENSISFDRQENGSLNITIVKTHFDEEIISTGKLGELNFRALASGETELNFSNQDCEFYNSLGEIIDMPNLEFENIFIIIN